MSILERIRTWHTGRVERRRVIDEQCAAIDQEQRRAWVEEAQKRDRPDRNLEDLTPEQLDRILAMVMATVQREERQA